MANFFTIPHSIAAGEGALKLACSELQKFGSKALIVTDPMMVKLGNAKVLTDMLDTIAVQHVVYDGITGEPNHEMIDRGVELYHEQGCDMLIAIGGGSPIDSMKAIAAVASNGGSICDYVGKKLDHPLPPTCAIPTTAGTGSEATSVTIITNLHTQVKMMIKDPALMVRLAIVDPQFTLTAPPSVTATTGVDALCHAVEAYTSTKAYTMSDMYALSAVKRIFRYLYRAYEQGSDTKAREEMAIASLEAGIAFSNASVTIVHGMSRPIGALFHVPHGASNAMLLDKCLRFALPGAPERFCDLAKAVGVYQSGMSADEGALSFVQAVSELLQKLEIPSPAKFGIDHDAFFASIDKLAADAMASGSPANTRRQPTEDDLKAIYRSLWEE